MSKREKKGLVPALRFPEFHKEETRKNKKLGNLSVILRGGSPRPIDDFMTNDVGGLNWLKIGDVDKSAKYISMTKERVVVEALNKTREVHSGDLIMSNSMSFGRPYIMQIKSCIHDGWIAVTEIKDYISLDYLYYFILSESSQFYFLNAAAGGGIRNLNADIIKLLPVTYPKSKIEQQKIADCLSSIDALVTVQNQKIEALKAHKKGLMQQLFPAKGETVPKLRFPEFGGDWTASTMEEVSSISSGGTPSRAKPEYWNGDIPWVSTTLIDFNKIQKSNELISELGLNNSSAKIFPEGTILMAMYGQGKTRGKVAMLGIKASINQACAAISVKNGMNKEFVFQDLAGRYDEIRDISNQGGQENLSAGLIKKIPFSYPDIESSEQQKIADFLSSVDELITAQGQKIDALKSHKKGLMQQLFPAVDEVAV